MRPRNGNRSTLKDCGEEARNRPANKDTEDRIQSNFKVEVMGREYATI